MLNVGIAVLGVFDPRRAARFWTQALGYERRPPRSVDWDGYPDDPAAPNYDKYVVLADPEGNRFCVVDGSDERPQAESRG